MNKKLKYCQNSVRSVGSGIKYSVVMNETLGELANYTFRAYSVEL